MPSVRFDALTVAIGPFVARLDAIGSLDRSRRQQGDHPSFSSRGQPVGPGQARLLRIAIEAAGAVIIPDGATVDGVAVFCGVGLRSPRLPTPPPDPAGSGGG